MFDFLYLYFQPIYFVITEGPTQNISTARPNIHVPIERSSQAAKEPTPPSNTEDISVPPLPTDGILMKFFFSFFKVLYKMRIHNLLRIHLIKIGGNTYSEILVSI